MLILTPALTTSCIYILAFIVMFIYRKSEIATKDDGLNGRIIRYFKPILAISWCI
jgi:hypothetical protein